MATLDPPLRMTGRFLQQLPTDPPTLEPQASEIADSGHHNMNDIGWFGTESRWTSALCALPPPTSPGPAAATGPLLPVATGNRSQARAGGFIDFSVGRWAAG
jgi:hypothetical protein